MRAPAALANPRVLEELGLTEQQKAQLRLAREQSMEKMRKLQEESFERSLDVLSGDQVERLEQMTTEGYPIGLPQ